MKEWQKMIGITMLGVTLAVMGYFTMFPLRELARANMRNVDGFEDIGVMTLLAGIGLTVLGITATYRSFWRERVQLLETYLRHAQKMYLEEAVEALNEVGICFAARPAFSAYARTRKLFWRQDVEVIGDTLGTLMTGTLKLGPNPIERREVMRTTAGVLVDQYIPWGEFRKYPQDEKEWPRQLRKLVERIGVRHPGYVPELSKAILAVCNAREELEEEAEQKRLAKRVRRITR